MHIVLKVRFEAGSPFQPGIERTHRPMKPICEVISIKFKIIMQKLNNPSSKRKSSVTNCVYPNKEKFQPRRRRRRRKTNVMQCCQLAIRRGGAVWWENPNFNYKSNIIRRRPTTWRPTGETESVWKLDERSAPRADRATARWINSIDFVDVCWVGRPMGRCMCQIGVVVIFCAIKFFGCSRCCWLLHKRAQLGN